MGRANGASTGYGSPLYCDRKAPGRMHQSRVSAPGTDERLGAYQWHEPEDTFSPSQAGGRASVPEMVYDKPYFRRAMDQDLGHHRAYQPAIPFKRPAAVPRKIDVYLDYVLIIVVGLCVGRIAYYLTGISVGAY